MLVRTYRAFATELLKIACDLDNKSIRASLSLEKNANYAIGSSALLRAKKKEDSAYQTVRDTGVKVLGGAAAAGGTLKLVHDMAGTSPTPKEFKVAVGIGAGLALADKAFRHRQEISDTVRRKPKLKTAFVQSNPSATFKSPAEALSSRQNVGMFQDKRIHTGIAKPTV